MTKREGVFTLLTPFMEPVRKERLEEVVNNRTKGVVLVLENLVDPHNLSAILRSAEALGLQYVHLAGDWPDGLNPMVTRGSDAWLTLRRERDTAAMAARLKEEGYLLAATLPSSDGIDPCDYRGDKPVALMMGNEHSGLGGELVGRADLKLTIPHPGFTRSLNVSVAAAVFIHALLRNEKLRNFPLEESEKVRLLDLWATRSVPNSERVLREVKKRKRGVPAWKAKAE